MTQTVSVLLIALTLLLPSTQPATAQIQQPLPTHLAELVRSKWEMIKLESAAANDEWAGRYRASNGPTISTELAWSPAAGFIVWWENCSRPDSARVNHGGAVFQNSVLKITPQVSQNSPGAFNIASDLIPVKWGAQHFLIPQGQLLKFIYAANSGSVSEIETFLLKHEDYNKKRTGLPGVPPEYARYLGRKPIIATISGIGPEVERWYPKVILNVGKREGVIPEMKFYRLQGGAFTVLEVTSVDEHRAEAAVVLASTRNDVEEIKLKTGWRFSSRAPKNSRQFMP